MLGFEPKLQVHETLVLPLHYDTFNEWINNYKPKKHTYKNISLLVVFKLLRSARLFV